MDVSPNQLGLGRGGADPVPRERRREPRAHGLEHAAPGGAAACAPRRRSSAPAWRRWSRATPASPSSRAAAGVVEQVDAERIVVKVDKPNPDGRDPGVDIYNLVEVPALEPEHVHQPAADRRRRAIA